MDKARRKLWAEFVRTILVLPEETGFPGEMMHQEFFLCCWVLFFTRPNAPTTGETGSVFQCHIFLFYFHLQIFVFG